MSSRGLRHGGSVVAAIVGAVLMIPGVAWAAPPSNDDFENAKVVTDIPYSDTIDSTDATSRSNEDGLCGYGGSVWYSFTPASDVRLVGDTFGSDYDTYLAAFAGPPARDTMKACNDNWRSYQSRISFDAAAGTTYYFMIRGGGGVLTFNLAVGLPPAHDELSTAKRIPVKQLPWTHRATTTEATLNIDDPSCSGKSRSVWYRYETPRRGGERLLQMNTFGSDYDTTLSVYKGRPGSLEQVACDDNSRGYQSRVRFTAKPGVVYHVMVASARNTAGGNLRFNVTQPPVPFKFSSSLSSSGTVSTVTGSATLSGTATCSRKARVRISVRLRQRNDDHVVSASAGKYVKCSGTTGWKVTVSNERRSFQAGSAGAWVRLEAVGEKRSREHQRVVRLAACSGCL